MRPRPLVLALALAGAVVVAACGKTGPSPGDAALVAGVYHLQGAALATNLELRDDGTFTLRADSCDSSGVLACGDWTAAGGHPHVVARDGLYWPTPGAFPSSVVRRVTIGVRDRELVVIGTSEWAGTFTQRWSRGRTCAVCSAHGGTVEAPCAAPLPACARM
jgi:hypothetical protein